MRLTGRAAGMYAASVILVLLAILAVKSTWQDYAYASGLAEGLQEWTRGRGTAATYQLRELSLSYDDEPVPFEARARILIENEENWPEARELLSVVTERWPERHSGWLSLGTLELREGNLDEARDAFEKAEKLTEAAEPLLGLAAVLWAEGDIERAATQLDASIDKSAGLPGSVARELLGAHVELELGTWDAAVMHYERAFALAPHDRSLGEPFASVLIRGLLDKRDLQALPERIERVLALLDESEPALKGSAGKNRWYLSSSRWRLLLAIGMAYTALDDWKAAAEHFDEAVGEIGRDALAEHYFTKGLAMSRVVAEMPDDEDRNRAAREAAHAYYEASKDLRERDEREVERLQTALGNAAIMRVHAGDYPNALKVCNTMEDLLDPEKEMDVWLYLVQAVCNDHRGGRYLDDASAYYKRALDLNIEDDQIRLQVVDRLHRIEREQ